MATLKYGTSFLHNLSETWLPLTATMDHGQGYHGSFQIAFQRGHGLNRRVLHILNPKRYERYITTMIKKTPSALIKSCIARECLLSSDGVHLILRKFCLKVMQSNHKLLRTIWFVCPALENTPHRSGGSSSRVNTRSHNISNFPTCPNITSIGVLSPQQWFSNFDIDVRRYSQY